MEQETSRNIRLGIFVAAGTLCLIIAFYFVGSKQNLFGSTFRINALFYNVNGLVEGNNVRFAGIDVGTVESLEIINDSAVLVTMVLDEKAKKFIRQNAIASVGTDGLMGNKLVNINSTQKPSPFVTEGSSLNTLRPLEMDEMTRTLNVTNNNMADISGNLKGITDKIRNKNTFWELLMDTLVSENIKTTLQNLKDMSVGAKNTANYLQEVGKNLANKQSSLGKIISDTVLYKKVANTVEHLNRISDSAETISNRLALITHDLKNGKGSAGKILRDTLLAHQLQKDLRSIDSAAYNFNLNMVALQTVWPFKRYFKKKAQKK